MAYKPIYDCSFDVACDNGSDGIVDVLNILFSNKLMLIGFTDVGPGGGNPNFVVRGTKTQIIATKRDIYEETGTDEEIWEDAMATGIISVF